jgi:hypothetical protein
MRRGRRRLKGPLVALLVISFAGLPSGAGLRSSDASTQCADPPTANRSAHAKATRLHLNGKATSLLGTTPISHYVCPVGRSKGVALLDVTVTRRGAAAADFHVCVLGIDDTSKLGRTEYVRSSRVPGSRVQRVAFQSLPGRPLPHPEYVIQVRAVDQAEESSCDAEPTGEPLGDRIEMSLTMKYREISRASPRGGFAFATRHLPPAGGPLGSPGEAEPYVLVDRLRGDRVYVAVPQYTRGCLHEPVLGECSGNGLWFSLDRGQTFSYCDMGLGLGGNDSHLAIDAKGSIYSADLAYFAAGVWMQKLAAGSGRAPPTPRKRGDCGFSSPTIAAPGDADRPWLAVYSPRRNAAASKVFLGVNTLQGPKECSSLDGGTTWGPCVSIISDGVAAAEIAQGGYYGGNQAFDSRGVVFVIFVTAGSSGFGHNVYVAASEDGVRFVNHRVHVGLAPGAAESANTNGIYWFPNIAIDRADNLYAAWTETRLRGGRVVIKFASSRDHGRTWTKPVTVSDPSLGVSEQPWLVAGDAGRVNVVWRGTKTKTNAARFDGDVPDPQAEWHVYMAQSLNGTSAAPRFVTTRVTPYPIRHGPMCFGCGDDGRILLDFVSVDIDRQCMAHIAYGNAGPDTSGVGSGSQPFTDYARQTKGPSLCAP